MKSKPQLWILGMPLTEEDIPSPACAAKLKEANVVVGESRAVTDRYLKRSGATADKVFFLDPFRKLEWEALCEELVAKSKTGGIAVLLSDMGMPILFDPGLQVLEKCRALGYTMHSVPSATSWGSAAALSGYPPPFLVVGFPPRETGERQRFFKSLQNAEGAIVLMDTPYRFRLLLKELTHAFGSSREAFLAWEIAKPGERLLWGPLVELEKQPLEKGEFVIIVKGKASRKTAHYSSRSGESF